MMKKLLPLTTLVAGALLSGQALAAGANITSGNAITPIDCAALDNNVTVQLSKNVYAGYTCNLAGTALRAGTCHSSGTNKETTQTCTWTSEIVDGVTIYTPNFTACGTTPDPVDATAATQVTATGRVGFRGASGGGTVGPAELGSTNCDADAVVTDLFMPAYLD